MIDVSKGKILDLVKNVMTEIFCISRRCHSGELPRLRSEKQCQHGHHDQKKAQLYDISHIAVCDAHIDDIRHQKRDQHFQQHFQHDKHRRQYRLALVFPDRTE